MSDQLTDQPTDALDTLDPLDTLLDRIDALSHIADNHRWMMKICEAISLPSTPASELLSNIGFECRAGKHVGKELARWLMAINRSER